MIDKKSVIIGTFAGMLLGIITAVFLAGIIISSIGESFQVENMNITVALNQTQLENVIRESPGYQTARAEAETEVNAFLYEGVYGWFCYDTSTYYPSLSDHTQSYEDRGCKLLSIETEKVNRSYYHDNGWD